MERLAQGEDGDLLYNFTRVWSDGTRGIQLSPLELLEKLAYTSPADRFPLCSKRRLSFTLGHEETTMELDWEVWSLDTSQVSRLANLRTRLSEPGFTLESFGIRGVHKFDRTELAYTLDHTFLERGILHRGGLLISEYDVPSDNRKDRLLQRDRIITALSAVK